MKPLAFFCVAALALGACQPDAVSHSSSSETLEMPPAAAPATPTPSEAGAAMNPEVPATSPATADPGSAPDSLVGEYRIAGVDGEGIDLPFGISASISADRIRVSSQCVRFAWSYSYAKGALSTEQAPTLSCQRGLYPEEEAIEAAFDAATQVRITSANGYEFTGGGHEVTLFTQ